MRNLIDWLADGVSLPVPAAPDALFDALIAVVSDIRGREVVLLKEEFPHRTATGLWLDMPDHDIVLVDKRAVVRTRSSAIPGRSASSRETCRA